MPIVVKCPSCKSSFSVSEKFAGKQGPCPKCKAKITIPKVEPVAETPVKEEVKVHEPEAGGPKGKTGRPTTKPIARRETKFGLVPAMTVTAAALTTVVIAWIARTQFQDIVWRGLGLLIVSPPLALAGYTFLRNDELEPYRGLSVWLRATICALVYCLLWGIYYRIPPDMTESAWNWIILGPPFFLVGAIAAYATFDLDFGNAFFHYCFYFLTTLGLGAAAGLQMPWAGVTT